MSTEGLGPKITPQGEDAIIAGDSQTKEVPDAVQAKTKSIVKEFLTQKESDAQKNAIEQYSKGKIDFAVKSPESQSSNDIFTQFNKLKGILDDADTPESEKTAIKNYLNFIKETPEFKDAMLLAEARLRKPKE